MRTSNGLDVPTGWGQRRPADRRPCPRCLKATDVVTNRGGFRALDEHTRRGSDQRCTGSGRLVD
jgi:hypothetical protein